MNAKARAVCEACAATLPGERGRACAFTKVGRFTASNWMCETMNRLREKALFTNRDDLHSGSIAVVLLPDVADLQGYIVLSFYKERGTVGAAVLMNNENTPKALTRSIAEAAVRSLQ